MTIQPTDEMIAAVAALINDRDRIPVKDRPTVTRHIVEAVLALAETEYSYQAEAGAAAERNRIRTLLSGPFLNALRAVPDGEIRSGCTVLDGATTREQARTAYRQAFHP